MDPPPDQRFLDNDTHDRLPRMNEEPWFTGPKNNRKRYRVVTRDPIGGSDSLVFQAVDGESSGNRLVALKQLPRTAPERVHSLLARSGSLAALNHPGIARHIETFEGPGLFTGEIPHTDDCHVLYTASEWVEGLTLSAAISTMGTRASLTVLEQMADAINYVHARGVVHRDLHPENVIINPVGIPVIIDFGHARAEAPASATQVHGAVGFVPPERFNDASAATASGDVWQLGMLAVFMLTGRTQGRQSIAAVRQDLATALTPLAHDPEAAARRVCEALDADPTCRPTDVREWSRSILASPSTGRRMSSRRRLIAVATATLLVVAASPGIRRLTVSSSSTQPAAQEVTSSNPTSTAGAASSAGTIPTSATPPPSTTVESLGVARCGNADDVKTPTEDGSIELAAAIRTIITNQGLCPGGPSVRNGHLMIQSLVTPARKANGAVIASANSAVVLTESQWGSYHQIGARDGSRYLATVGAPLSIDTSPERTVVTLEHGLLIGTSPDAPHFWIPEPAIPVWNDSGAVNGALGLPTSNPYTRSGTIEQDYQHGYLTLRSDDPTVHINYVDNPAAELPGQPENHILRQPDGTAWYIDKIKQRRWVPDGATWICLDGDHIALPNDFPGYALATLNLGPTAACP